MSAVIRQVPQRGRRGHLAETVHVVTVPDFVQRGDQVAVTDEIADPLEAERVCLGKGSCHQDVRIFQRQFQRIFLRKIRIRLVQHRDAGLRPAKRFKVPGRVTAPGRRVGRGQERQRGVKFPGAAAFQFRHSRQAEIRPERHGVFRRAVNVRQHRIQRIAGREVLNDFGGASSASPRLWFRERSGGQRQQFIRTVANDEIVRCATVQPGQLLAQQLRRRIRIQPQAAVDRRPDRGEDFGRRRIRVLVGVELDQSPDLRLFAVHVGMQPAHQRADQRLRQVQGGGRIRHGR